MSDTIPSPNMNMPVPIVGVDPGPDWANNINACLGILDQHDHSSGLGVKITPNGIDINIDLPMNENNLTRVNTVNFTALLASLPGLPPNLGAIYVAGNELYYNDEAGNVVQITNSGSVNAGAGSITGLPSGTASASYSAGSQTFIWQSATSTPANMDFGGAIFRNIVANSKGLDLLPPNAMAADYSVTLPPPNSSGSTAFLIYDTANNIGVGPSTTLGITGANIANLTITDSKIAAGTLTKDKNAVYTPQISASSGNFTTTTNGEVDITNQTVTITTFGNPVNILLAAEEISFENTSNTGSCQVRLYRGVTAIYLTIFRNQFGVGTVVPFTANFSFLDTPAAGTYTYKLTADCAQNGTKFLLTDGNLTAYEI